MLRFQTLAAALLLSAGRLWAQEAAPTQSAISATPAALTAPAPATDAAAAPAVGAPSSLDTRGLDQEVQDLKKDVLDLNRDLFLLEEELLFLAHVGLARALHQQLGHAVEDLRERRRQPVHGEVAALVQDPRELARRRSGGGFGGRRGHVVRAPGLGIRGGSRS